MRPTSKTEPTEHLPGPASRRQILAGGAGLAMAALLPAGSAGAQSSSPDSSSPGSSSPSGEADFLFVQTSDAMAFDAHQNRLTLRDVSQVTLFFTDRPERMAGNMKTADFIPFWSEGTDSFLSDPPNADLSILEDGQLRQIVVVLHDPVLQGNDLHYTVKIIDGDMPVQGDERVDLHRHHRHAADAAVVRRCPPPRLAPSGLAVMTTEGMR